MGGLLKENDRIRIYSKQLGISSVGAFKNGTTKSKLLARLTPKQQRRVEKKSRSVV